MLTSTTVETLTLIWQHVLQRSPISPEDSFFDLGGDDPLVDVLVAEIARAFNRELPRTMIARAPTIAALAALLEKPSLPRFNPFVQIKRGTGRPVFIVHGLAGTAAFFALARHIETSRPIYGVEAKGTDGVEEPYERVEDMVTFYLDALKNLEAQGPYMLIGYSFGGLVAIEMARRLSADGKRIALLALLDTYPHSRYLSVGQHLRLIAQQAKYHFDEMRQLAIPGALAYFVRGLRRRWHLPGALNDSERRAEGLGLSFARTALRVREKAYLAMAAYRPSYYDGKIKFVTTEIKSFFLPLHPAKVWTKLADEIEVETIPGDHLEMVNVQFEGLASVLTRYIQQAIP